MAPKSVTFRRHDHLVSVLFGDLFSHSYNITFSMFLYLVSVGMASEIIKNYTYKCVNRSRHNGIKGAKAKCAH